MIASIAMFNTYSGNYEDSPEAVELKGAFLCTAEHIVSSYLGFDPKQQEYTDVVASGSGSRRLYLRVATSPVSVRSWERPCGHP